MQKQTNNILFRCSSLGHLMTEPKAAKDKEAGNLSEGAKTHCVDVFTLWHYSRREEFDSKYFRKGNAVEEDSITALSLFTKNFYKKNEDWITNEFISGTPDLFILDKKGDVQIVEDIKSSWNMFTFMRSKFKSMDKMYYWQLMGYMALTGAKEARLRYCVVNATPELIDDEKRRLMYAMNVIDTEKDEAYIERCRQIEINMIYDMKMFNNQHPHYDFANSLQEWRYDIPLNERIHTFEIERNDSEIELIYKKVQKARKYISEVMELNPPIKKSSTSIEVQ